MDNVTVAEQGQITERYTRAIDQIGALRTDGSPAMEIRIGGLFALERIARESPTDYWAVADVIAAYLRMHARYELDARGKPLDPPVTRRPDVQAAVQVLRSLRPHGGERTGGLDLSSADLRQATLGDAHLEGAWFDRRWKAMLRNAGVHGFDEINWHGEDEDEAAAPEGTSADPSDETP